MEEDLKWQSSGISYSLIILESLQACSQDFQKGGYMDVESVCCMHNHVKVGGSGGMFPLKVRCSAIAFEAILGQKQSRSIGYVAHRVISKFSYVLRKMV